MKRALRAASFPSRMLQNHGKPLEFKNCDHPLPTAIGARPPEPVPGRAFAYWSHGVSTTALRKYAPIALALLCLLSAGVHLSDTLRSFEAKSVSQDMVARWEERMLLVAEALPPPVSVVGYLDASDLRASQTPLDTAEFFLTQYALAPVAIEQGARHEWIVGNFGAAVRQGRIKATLDRKLGAYTLQDFGFGLYLIHKTGT